MKTLRDTLSDAVNYALGYVVFVVGCCEMDLRDRLDDVRQRLRGAR